MTTMMPARRAERPRARAAAAVASKGVRVVAYCRRSLEKTREDFGSIEAQRSAIASYVESQKGAGWTLLPIEYEDRNISGATTDRPALQRLLADAKAGMFDLVAVHKFDRMSRRLVDFLDLIAQLQDAGVAVASITQSIDTSTPVGRLMLNVLASFGEFEREQIAERIRDKMGAARKRGQWQGGRPVLGYDVDRKRLVINTAEAEQVRFVFETYRRTESVVRTLEALDAQGIRHKSWTNQRGRDVVGTRIDKHGLKRLLTNPLYRGKLLVDGDLVEADHEAIIDEPLWNAVQKALATTTTEGRGTDWQPHQALLGGLLKCACGAGMVATHSTRRNVRHHYYECGARRRHGARACPGSRVSEADMDAEVVGMLRDIGSNADLAAQAVEAARAHVRARLAEVTEELREAKVTLKRLAGGNGRDETAAEAERQIVALREEQVRLRAGPPDAADLRRAIQAWSPVWGELFPPERRRIVQLLVAEAVFDARAGTLSVWIRADGLPELAAGGAA